MVHAMAHALGGHSNLPHGVCNAVLLPFVLDFHCRDARLRARLTRVAEAMELPERSPEAVVRRTRAMAEELGIPVTLREAAEGRLTPEAFPALAEIETAQAGDIMAIAVKIGKTRLIDNVILEG